MRRTIVEWGSVVVQVTGNKLTATMINADGKERDEVQIIKDAKAPPVRVAHPRKPEPAEGPKKLRSKDQKPDPRGEEDAPSTSAPDKPSTPGKPSSPNKPSGPVPLPIPRP